MKSWIILNKFEKTLKSQISLIQTQQNLKKPHAIKPTRLQMSSKSGIVLKIIKTQQFYKSLIEFRRVLKLPKFYTILKIRNVFYHVGETPWRATSKSQEVSYFLATSIIPFENSWLPLPVHTLVYLSRSLIVETKRPSCFNGRTQSEFRWQPWGQVDSKPTPTKATLDFAPQLAIISILRWDSTSIFFLGADWPHKLPETFLVD